MTLLFPLGLAALAGVLVPLAIHIARRSEQKLTDFAALRWLRERPRPRSRLRFDERLLLALRLILLVVAALWLAQPVLIGAADSQPYVAVIPGASYHGNTNDQVEAHWLAPGFPSLDTPRPSGSLPTASLLRELDATLPPGTQIAIVAPPILDGADAERPRLSRPVRWHITGGARPAPSAPVAPPPPIAVRADAAHRSSVLYLRAAGAAWAAPGDPAQIDIASPSAPLPPTSVTLFWMAGGSLPDALRSWVARGGHAVIASDALWPDDLTAFPVWFDPQGGILARKGKIGSGQLVHLSRSLSPSQMPLLLESDFPDRLRDLIAPAPPPTRVQTSDYAPLTGGPSPLPRPDDLRPWLAVLIAALLCAERWIATRRSRAPAP
ncbi:hypothetical protein SAMIE_1008400 [Sphingobium amiense]|uniref:Aerotolerance regulator N-terminal domain-containing protein n=1 Tax=Sphingobium amiense TaxID=135719 RepID=A0A494WAU1_9SPHN|nr:BatA domain-containing protein [Sphingobium amiense]BBD97339.1 hypothetical protein SAMIE_1008400 [Sphingobium amiense]